MITLYGIPNCDTVKKARDWLVARGVEYAFHDYKKAGADAGRIAGWVEQAGWEKADIDAAKAVMLMAANPSAIRRPVVEVDGKLIAVGFKPDEWEAALGRGL